MSNESQPPRPKAPPPLPPRAPAPGPRDPGPRAAGPLPGTPLPGAMHDYDDIGVYRHDRKLVIERGATLPDICIRCGAPAGHRVHKRYALSFSGSAKVDVPVCEKHRGVRRTLLAVTWALFAASIVTFYFAVNKISGNLGWAGAALLVACFIVAIFVTNYLGYASRIDRDYVWVKGVGRAFLDRLPPFV